MDWRALKWAVNQLEDNELNKPVEFYDLYFKRSIKVQGVDHLSTLERGDPSDRSSPLVLIGSMERK